VERETFAATAFLALASSIAFFACATNSTFDENLQLSTSTAQRRVAPGLAVTVTKTAILVDGAAVAPIAANKVDPKLKSDGENGYRITPLIEALEKRTKFSRQVAGQPRKPVDTHLTLIADRALSYRLFTEIVFSCGQLGYDKYDLVVKNATDGSLAAIRYTIPQLPVDRGPPSVTVWVRLNAFGIVTPESHSWLEVPKMGNGRYDYASLTARVSELTAWAQDPDPGAAALVGADENVPYEVVVATIDALGRTHDGRPLFPIIEFAAGVQ
jgi:biopolymer transport protein ExbD